MSITRFLTITFLGSFFGTLGVYGLTALGEYLQLVPTVVAFWAWLPEYICVALGVATLITVVAAVIVSLTECY